MKKVYTIEHDFIGASVSVEIDDEKVTEEVLTEMNDFWFGAEDRLFESDNSVLNAVLMMLAKRVFCVQFSEGLNIHGIIKDFEKAEGWPPMDGSHGFKIVKAKSFDIDSYDMCITEGN